MFSYFLSGVYCFVSFKSNLVIRFKIINNTNYFKITIDKALSTFTFYIYSNMLKVLRERELREKLEDLRQKDEYNKTDICNSCNVDVLRCMYRSFFTCQDIQIGYA